jgi:hypothetical protein
MWGGVVPRCGDSRMNFVGINVRSRYERIEIATHSISAPIQKSALDDWMLRDDVT